ncbi:SEGN protein, partial [Ardeotis kori]|nr:SEGN protein [Ardeotis kori]
SGSPGRLDAAAFLGAWRRFDTDGKWGRTRVGLDNGYIEGKELDNFFHHLLEKLGPEVSTALLDHQPPKFLLFFTFHGLGLVLFLFLFFLMCFVFQLANMILPDDENFLLLFRRETPLDNSVEFMRIWRSYDADSSGFISAGELKDFLRDLFLQHNKMVAEVKLEEYTDTMVRKDGVNIIWIIVLPKSLPQGQCLGIGILALQENFLLQFKMDACSTEERRRDFEKIFAHYDVSKTGALEGPEVDGFVKDMMELVKPSISGVDLDKFRQILLNHCDVNKDGKIQKSELALCLGLKMNP